MSASAQFHALAQAKDAHTPTAREAEPLHPRVALGHDAADACLKGGILKGALHEVFAAEAGCEASASGFAAALALRVAQSGNGRSSTQTDDAQSSKGHHKQLLWIRH